VRCSDDPSGNIAEGSIDAASSGFVLAIAANPQLTWVRHDEEATDDRPFHGDLPDEFLADADGFLAEHGIRAMHLRDADPGESMHDLGGALAYRYWDWANEQDELIVLEPMPEPGWRGWLERNSPLGARFAEIGAFFDGVFAGFEIVSRSGPTTGATCILRATDYHGGDEVRLWVFADGSCRIDAKAGEILRQRLCHSADDMLSLYDRQLSDHFDSSLRTDGPMP